MSYDTYTVFRDRSRGCLVRTYQGDSSRYEMHLTWVARALKSFLEQVDHLQTYQKLQTPLTSLNRNLSYMSASVIR